VDGGGDALNINGLDYGLFGPNWNLVPDSQEWQLQRSRLSG
jgi:hypothetical protein